MPSNRVHLVLGITLVATTAAAQSEKSKTTYRDHIRPLFVKHCLRCHNSSNAKADLDLSSYRAALAGGSSGEVLVAQDASQSRLYRLVSRRERPHMPQGQPKLPDSKISLIRKWIAGGLLEDPGSKPKVSLRRSVLAFRGVRRIRPKDMPGLNWKLRKANRHRRANPVVALAAHPWRPWFVVGSHKQLLLYHSQTGKRLATIPFPDNGPMSLRFSGDGKWLTGAGGRGGESGISIIWDAFGGRPRLSLDDEEDTILAVDYSSRAKLLVYGNADHELKRVLFPTKQTKTLPPMKGHTTWISAVAIDPTGKWLASGDRGGSLFIWDLKRGVRVFVLRGHRGPVTAVCWRSDSLVMASSSDDGSVRLWVSNTGKLARGVEAHQGGALDVTFTHAGRIVSAGRDKRVKMWDSFGSHLITFPAAADSVTRVAVGHDNKTIIGGDFLGNLYLWNRAGKLLHKKTTNP